jgi:hypothetical protein
LDEALPLHPIPPRCPPLSLLSLLRRLKGILPRHIFGVDAPPLRHLTLVGFSDV